MGLLTNSDVHGLSVHHRPSYGKTSQVTMIMIFPPKHVRACIRMEDIDSASSVSYLVKGDRGLILDYLTGPQYLMEFWVVFGLCTGCRRLIIVKESLSLYTTHLPDLWQPWIRMQCLAPSSTGYFGHREGYDLTLPCFEQLSQTSQSSDVFQPIGA